MNRKSSAQESALPASPAVRPQPAAADGEAVDSASVAGLHSASFGRRLAALTVDCLLSVAVAALITNPSPPGAISALVLFVAYTFFIGLFGQTPGMRICRLVCIRFEPQGPLGIPRAALRALLLQLIVPAVIIDANGRGWHDRLANAIVVDAAAIK